MEKSYVSAKLVEPNGGLYCTVNTWHENGQLAGGARMDHGTPAGDVDRVLVVSPPTSAEWQGNVLSINGSSGSITVNCNNHIITWSSPDWSGSASCEWLAVVIDGVLVVNSVFA